MNGTPESLYRIGSVLGLSLAGLLLLASAGEMSWSAPVDGDDLQMSDLQKIRGVIKPSAEAILSSQIEGRISRLPFRDGQRFKRGSTLVWLDCTRYQAELSATYAEHEARVRMLQNNLGLLKLDAIGTLEVEISKVEVRKARAAIRVARVNVRGCRIRAPFAGRVVKLMVNEHENVFPNDQLVSILDDTRLEIELILPSTSLSWLKQGTPFTFAVDETDESYAAMVKDIGANVDPVSQTIRVIGRFKDAPKGVLSGMSGTALFAETLP